MKGLLPWWERSQNAPSALLPYEDTARRWPLNQEANPHQTTHLLAPQFWTPVCRWETQSLLFISPWSVAFLLELPQWMMTGVKGHDICSSLSRSSEIRVFCLQNTDMEGRANDRAGRQTAWLSLGARFAGVFLLCFSLQLFCKPEWFQIKRTGKETRKIKSSVFGREVREEKESCRGYSRPWEHIGRS